MRKKKIMKLSIVIPTLNEEKYLEETLKSIKNQSKKDYEIIISDGGSTDKTPKIAQKYEAKFLVSKNTNVCQARNNGMKMANSNIIVCCDADTIYDYKRLTLIEKHMKNPQVVAVTGKGVMVDGPFWGKIIWKLIYAFIDIVYRTSGYVLYAPAYNLAFKKDALEKVGGYNTNLDFGGDELDVLRRLKNIGKIVYDPEIIAYTNGRRYKVGFFTFIFKHAIYYYGLNYIYARIFGKPLVKAKPVR
jgi:glycosyltransferase involved in cell wall biosynthesis